LKFNNNILLRRSFVHTVATSCGAAAVAMLRRFIIKFRSALSEAIANVKGEKKKKASSSSSKGKELDSVVDVLLSSIKKELLHNTCCAPSALESILC